MEDLISNDSSNMKLDLNDQELNDLQEFLKTAESLSLEIVDTGEAIKFLRAKKFDVTAALDLYKKHQAIRKKENLYEINPFQSDVLRELFSKKFTFLLNCDLSSGASICIFTVKLHLPSKTSHQNVLKALIFQLDAALSTSSAQKNGLIFLYNMCGSKYSNFDIQLSVKILNLLKGAYPARLCKLIILTPPIWFRASFNILKLFVRQKLQDRINIVIRKEDLYRQISKEILPKELGGSIEHDHIDWLKRAFASMGYPDQTFSPDLNAQINVPGINDTEKHSFQSNHQYSENDIGNLTSGKEYIDEEVGSEPIADGRPCTLHQRSTTPISSGVITQSPTTESANQQIFVNDIENSSIDSGSSGQGSFIPENSSSNYEMLSITSWDLNMTICAIENSPEGEDDLQNMDHESHVFHTSEDSLNSVCWSATFSDRPLEEMVLLRNEFIKRTKDVSYETKVSNNKSNCELHRQEFERSLHNAIVDDIECEYSGDGDRGVTLDFFAQSSDHSTLSTLNEFRTDLTFGNVPIFTAYSNPVNAAKNRYTDIPCIESSRVKLARNRDLDEHLEINRCLPTTTDYIHANWVDGYRQKNAFICTQGPLNATVSDFWQMVIQYRIPIIIMTTRIREQNREKCYQYWPIEVGDTKIITGVSDQCDTFEVTSLRSREFGPRCPQIGICEHSDEHWYCVTLLRVRNYRTGQEHRVNHFFFHSWPDQGIPNSSEGFLNFILHIRQTYRLNISKLGYESEMDQIKPPPPILVHCSAGIGRTGTYVVTEICLKSLSDCGRFNLLHTMLKVRSQRYKAVQNAQQYLYCRNSIIDYALRVGLLYLLKEKSDVEEIGEE